MKLESLLCKYIQSKHHTTFLNYKVCSQTTLRKISHVLSLQETDDNCPARVRLKSHPAVSHSPVVQQQEVALPPLYGSAVSPLEAPDSF